MKRLVFFVFGLLFLVSPCFSQDYNKTDAKGRRQGKWCDFYPNGQKRYEGQFKNDKCTGEFRYFDEQGNLKATNKFDKSGEKAQNQTFAANGKVIAMGTYVNQKKEGEWRYFDKETGKLVLVEDNKNGKVDGWSRVYNPDTERVAEEAQYVAGIREGACRQYFDSGYLMMECEFHHNQMNGPAKTYFPNTALKEEGSYLNGQKTGQWKTYNEDGDLIVVETFGVEE
ncbi:MAG: hypothetical protein MJZ91_05090 [Bacteroidales bacterium]|nr:hypothetical protein [Bacteroidales bacterium]